MNPRHNGLSMPATDSNRIHPRLEAADKFAILPPLDDKDKLTGTSRQQETSIASLSIARSPLKGNLNPHRRSSTHSTGSQVAANAEGIPTSSRCTAKAGAAMGRPAKRARSTMGPGELCQDLRAAADALRAGGTLLQSPFQMGIDLQGLEDHYERVKQLEDQLLLQQRQAARHDTISHAAAQRQAEKISYASQLAAASTGHNQAGAAVGGSAHSQLKHRANSPQQIMAATSPVEAAKRAPWAAAADLRRQRQASSGGTGCTCHSQDDDAGVDSCHEQKPALLKSAMCSGQQQQGLPSFAPFIRQPGDGKQQQGQQQVMQLTKFMAGTFNEQAAMLQQLITDITMDASTIPFIQLEQASPMSIARGGFAQVYTGRWNGKQVAIKVPLDKVALDVIVQEALELHHVQRCQEVVRFHGMALQHGLGSGLPGLVMDYMAGGSVGEILERYKQQRLGPLLVPFDKFKLTNQQLIYGLSFGLNCAWALQRLHTFGLLHLDVKTDNFLSPQIPRRMTLRQLMDLQVVIADLGLAKCRHLDKTGVTAEFRGTLHWMAPEVLAQDPSLTLLQTGGMSRYDVLELGKYRLTPQTDVYSLAVVLWQCGTLNVYHPYEHIDPSERRRKSTARKIMALVNPERPRRPSYFPDALWKLLVRCWDPTPAHRPNVDQVIRELSNIIDELTMQAAPAPAGQKDK